MTDVRLESLPQQDRTQGLRQLLRAQADWSIVPAGIVLSALISVHAEDACLVAWAMTIAIAAIVAWIVVRDIRTFTIPDGASVTIAMLAGSYHWAVGALAGDPADATILAACLGAALPGGLLLAFREYHYRRKGVDGLGLGDVKLAAAGGLLIGMIGFSWALCAASLLALCFVLLQRVFARRQGGRALRLTDRLAFGAFLAPAILAVWVAQQITVLLPVTNG